MPASVVYLESQISAPNIRSSQLNDMFWKHSTEVKPEREKGQA